MKTLTEEMAALKDSIAEMQKQMKKVPSLSSRGGGQPVRSGFEGGFVPLVLGRAFPSPHGKARSVRTGMSNKERSRFASEASEDRELENKEFQTAVADQVATQQILEKVRAQRHLSEPYRGC